MKWLTHHLLLIGLCLCYVLTGTHSLRFTTANYDTMVHETFLQGGYDLPPDGFLQVDCIDDVTGVPAMTIVVYSIVGGNSGPFEINSTNGGLSVIDGRTLDYETATSYTFTVMCTNTSNVNITATAQVSITLLPVNDFEPMIVSGSILTITLSEITPIGTTLVSTIQGQGMRQYSVTDGDDGPDGVITYTLSETSSESSTFSVDPVTGSLVLVQSLDVDNTPRGFDRISVRIAACDGDPPREDCPVIVVSLIVLSSNDNNPVFTLERYETSLPESAPIGTTVATLECTDADIGAGQFQGIEILSSDDGLFILPDTRNGTVVLNNTLDYETNRTHTIALICHDTQGRVDTAEIIVTVQPVNDNPPQFNQTTYEFSVNRFSVLTSVVGRVYAFDRDIVEDGETTLTYTIEGDTDNFEISDDGTITLGNFILALEGSRFELTVTVDDQTFNTSSTVLITVEGLLSIPDVILIAVGGLILLILLCILFICVCTCGLKCGKMRKPKQTSESRDNLNNPLPSSDPNMVPMPTVHENFYAHAQPYMIYQVPIDDRKWTSSQIDSDEDLDEPDYASVSNVSQTKSQISPGPVLQEMMDIFHDGDKMITKSKN